MSLLSTAPGPAAAASVNNSMFLENSSYSMTPKLKTSAFSLYLSCDWPQNVLSHNIITPSMIIYRYEVINPLIYCCHHTELLHTSHHRYITPRLLAVPEDG